MHQYTWSSNATATVGRWVSLSVMFCNASEGGADKPTCVDSDAVYPRLKLPAQVQQIKHVLEETKHWGCLVHYTAYGLGCAYLL